MKELIDIRDELLVGVENKDLLYIKMQINKLDTLIYENNEFYSLIDRLERASNIKYPNRQWNAIFKRNTQLIWIDKQDELLEQVLKLEKELNIR